MTTIEPGPVATKFSDSAKGGEIDATTDGLDDISLKLLINFKNCVSATFKDMAQQSEDIAKVILEAITSSSPHARYMTNAKYRDALEARYKDLTGDDFRKLLGDFCFGSQQQ